MPSKTFYRLPANKREAFITEALNEFSSHEYLQASVSSMVKNLGIAKGSLYQYFENKYDLYEYLAREAQNKLLAVAKFVDKREHEGLNVWFVHRTIAELKFAKEFSSEHMLLQKIRLSQFEDLKLLREELYQQDIALIKQVINRADVDGYNEANLAFVVRSVMDSFIQAKTLVSTTDDKLFEELLSLSDIIFD